jgi:hypothetical protein
MAKGLIERIGRVGWEFFVCLKKYRLSHALKRYLFVRFVTEQKNVYLRNRKYVEIFFKKELNLF